MFGRVLSCDMLPIDEHLLSLTCLPRGGDGKSGEGGGTFVLERCDSFQAGGTDTRDAHVLRNPITYDHGRSSAWTSHGEVVELDVLADCIGAACQSGNCAAILS